MGDRNSNNNEVLKSNVFFIGFMGAGKSTVARRLARTLGVSSIDMDKYIERSYGGSINSIFEEGGEDLFRQIESHTLEDLANRDEPALISCGGGIILKENNRRVLKDKGIVIHLLVDADEAAARISDKSSRPLFNDIKSARKRCNERLPLYEEAADITIMTGGRSVYSIADEVAEKLREAQVLCPQQK